MTKFDPMHTIESRWYDGIDQQYEATVHTCSELISYGYGRTALGARRAAMRAARAAHWTPLHWHEEV